MAKRRNKNEGTLYQRPNGRWRAQVCIDGSRASFTADSKAECQAWLRKMLDQAGQGWNYAGGKMTLGEYLQVWLENSRASLRLKTYDQYRRIVEKHILPHIGNTSLKDLRLERVERLYALLLKTGSGVRTVRIVHAVLHCSLEKAVRYGLILRNPTDGATLPQYKHAEMMVLDETQVSQLLVAAKGSRHQALYHLAVTTGMRMGELFGLRWSDLHWVSGKIYVRRQVQYVPGHGLSFVEPKTRSGRRTIKLGDGVLQALREHLERQEGERTTARERWVDHDLIFPSKSGTPMDPSNLRLDFVRVLMQAGLPKIRFHDLRHTAASLMLNHGIPVIVVSKILGHSKPSITMDIYGHLYNEMQGEASRLMDELVSPIKISLQTKTHQENPVD
jgi:integrase